MEKEDIGAEDIEYSTTRKASQSIPAHADVVGA